jgi:hypothetical protein
MLALAIVSCTVTLSMRENLSELRREPLPEEYRLSHRCEWWGSLEGAEEEGEQKEWEEISHEKDKEGYR